MKAIVGADNIILAIEMVDQGYTIAEIEELLAEEI